MINCKEFYDLLQHNGIGFFCGVPDSLLKHFCAYLEENVDNKSHVLTANEGNAIALAAGVYLSTQKIGMVYMQNSGIGNAVNPLVSLTDKEVYNIPVLLLIGWRGEPGKSDEPQHLKQGKITLSMLETLGIDFEIMPDNINDLNNCIRNACNVMKKEKTTYALIVRKDTFEPYTLQNKINTQEMSIELSREKAVQSIINQLNFDDVIISTTGKISRELYEYRDTLNQDHSRDFLTVGSMGHASHIALGIAMKKPNKKVYCLDGDGSVIMHMGALGIIGSQCPTNFIHIILNNGAHDSVGGQPTVGHDIDLIAIAEACGYNNVARVKSQKELKEQLFLLQSMDGPSFIEIIVKKGARSELGRPTTSPIENKHRFMEFFQE